MIPQTVTECLTSLKELLTPEERWIQGANALSPQKEPVSAVDPEACQWCLFGGLLNVLGLEEEESGMIYWRPSPSLYRTLYDLLEATIGEKEKKEFPSISLFNDTHTHQDVLSLLDLALEKSHAGE